MEAEEIGRSHEQRLDGVDREDRLRVEEPQPHEPVVEVVLVGREGRAALGDALGHHGQGVQHGEAQQDHERQHGAQACVPWVSMMESVAAEKPSSMLPVSPMKSGRGGC